MGDALAGEKRSALTLIGLQYDQLQKLEAQKKVKVISPPFTLKYDQLQKFYRLKIVKVISSPGDEGVGVRARLNLLEERLRGEASQERF